MNREPSPGEIITAVDVSIMELKTQIMISRTSLINYWRVTMKNIVLASVLGLGLISSVWATETVNIHERVNNAQAPAHQMQSAAAPVGIQGAAPSMTGMNQHEQAIIAHETMTNGSADAHQKMVESHQKMMGTGTVNASRPATSFAAMNEHERAAVAHEFTNNGQSGPHQAMADAHRRMINAG